MHGVILVYLRGFMFALVDWIYLGAYLGKKMMCNLQVHPEGAGGGSPYLLTDTGIVSK